MSRDRSFDSESSPPLRNGVKWPADRWGLVYETRMERVLWWFLILRLVRAQTLCVPTSGCSVTLDNGANLDFCNIFDNGDLTW